MSGKRGIVAVNRPVCPNNFSLLSGMSVALKKIGEDIRRKTVLVEIRVWFRLFRQLKLRACN